jgi:hypothetical protein
MNVDNNRCGGCGSGGLRVPQAAVPGGIRGRGERVRHSHLGEQRGATSRTGWTDEPRKMLPVTVARLLPPQ